MLNRTNIQVSAGETAAFETKYLDLFEKYRMSLISFHGLAGTWKQTPMQFWQNQLNIAVSCKCVVLA